MTSRIEDDKIINILLVDRCALVGELFGLVLAKHNIRIADQTFTCEEVPQKIKAHSPDVVLLNEAMYSEESYELCCHILRLYPQVKVFTYHWLDAWKWLVSQQGIQIAVKLTTVEEMVQAIRAIVQGLFYPYFIDHPMTSSRVHARGDSKLRAFGLNDTQVLILKLVAKGYTNRQIAQCLSLQVQTVKNNLNTIFRELYAQNRTEAVMAALREGILSWQDALVESELRALNQDTVHRTP